MSGLVRILAVALLVLLPVSAQALEKIAAGYNPVADFLLAFIAKDQGFFEKHGLDVDLKMTQVPLITMPSVLTAGGFDLAGVTPPAILQAKDNGLDLKIVAGADVTAKGYHLAGVIVRPSSDIKTAKDLEGKTVAVPGIKDLLHILLVKWLGDRGVDVAKVHFVEGPMVQLGDILKAERADAVVPVEPFMSRIVNSGGGRLLANYVDELPEGIPPLVWTSTGAWAEKHGEAIKEFRAALVDALVYYRTHPESADESMPHYIKLPPEALKAIPKPPMTTTVDASQIRFWVDVMLQQKLIGHAIDPASVLVP